MVGGGSRTFSRLLRSGGPGARRAAAIGDIFSSPPRRAILPGGSGGRRRRRHLLRLRQLQRRRPELWDGGAPVAAEGVDTRTVIFTDDVLSAPPARKPTGGASPAASYVFKGAGAAAARGDDLAGRSAHPVRQCRARTAGVGFAGCTVPGQGGAALHRRSREDGGRAGYPRRAGRPRRGDGRAPTSPRRWSTPFLTEPPGAGEAEPPCSSTGWARPSTRSCSSF